MILQVEDFPAVSAWLPRDAKIFKTHVSSFETYLSMRLA
jgi:hypothetical protein